MSSRDSIVAALREHAAELHSAGLLHLSLFGSVARDEAMPGSDVDLLAEFDHAAPPSLLTVSRLQNRISDLLGESVDLSAASWLKEPIRNRVLEESVRVF
jgi:uncharacterized protein